MMDQDLMQHFDQRQIPVDVVLHMKRRERKKAVWSVSNVLVWLPEKCEPDKIPIGTMAGAHHWGKLFDSREEAVTEVKVWVTEVVGNRPGWEVIYRLEVPEEEF